MLLILQNCIVQVTDHKLIRSNTYLSYQKMAYMQSL